MRNNKGYTLVEMLVVMAIFIIVIMITSSVFEKISRSSGQQLKSVETQIEGQVGLNLMRFDIEHAGFGLPWSFATSITYPEVAGPAPFPAVDIDPTNFNDKGSIPKAIDSGTSSTTGMDYLVVKSAMASFNATGKKWSFVHYSSQTTDGVTTNLSFIRQWKDPKLNFMKGENVVTLHDIPSQKDGSFDRQLAVGGGGAFYYSYTDPAPASDAFKPENSSDMFTVYGIDEQPLRMPYNRADFFVATPSGNMPSSCNPKTGILYKGVVIHGTGSGAGGFVQYPLLDCVGDLQVAFEMNVNGIVTPSRNLGAYAAGDIRDNLRRVLVFVLAHEGGRDMNYTYPVKDASKAIVVGDPAYTDTFGRIWTTAQLTAQFGADWNHYRWKVYTLAINPSNLNQAAPQ